MRAQRRDLPMIQQRSAAWLSGKCCPGPHLAMEIWMLFTDTGTAESSREICGCMETDRSTETQLRWTAYLFSFIPGVDQATHRSLNQATPTNTDEDTESIRFTLSCIGTDCSTEMPRSSSVLRAREMSDEQEMIAV